ncbi:MAG TPA: DUF2207 domain-containing protein [Candidatus Aphodovivens excrementavium]|nr:DUF2207 domain-containing protein [Candidatus Aphodovivens excrementavium]
MAQTVQASQNHHWLRSLDLQGAKCARPQAQQGAAHTCARAPHRAPCLLAAAALLAAAVLLACAFLCLRPSHAYASSYEMPKVAISAQAETDGSLHVIEQRTFAFDGDFSAVWWTFSGLPSNAEVVINSVRMVSVGDDGEALGYPQVLNSVPFVLSWRDEGGPGHDAYSFDQARDTVYVFFDASDEQRLIELDYTVVNGVTAYSDVGEVYWQFVGSQWEVDSNDVTMTLSLPVPSGVAVEPGNNVRAWGHGPLDGSVEINEDGSVVYTVPRVKAGSYVEARVVFPSDWLTNLPSGTVQPHRSEAHLSTVLSEEEAWADQANRARVLSLAFIIACALLCVAALCVGLWAYLRHGKEYDPTFKDEYWRDTPDKQTHPALIGRLWRWDRPSSDDFTATLMHLASVGALRIEKGTHEGNRPNKLVDDYLLTRLPRADQKTSDPLDAKAMSILFDEIAGGADTVWFDDIANYGGSNPQAYLDALESWQGLLSAEMNKRSFFEYEGKKWQVLIIVLAVIIAFAAVATWMSTSNFIPLVFAVPTVIGLVLLGNHTTRRSHEGNDLCARCKALRNWLRDFSALDERPPTDVAVWGEFMVYAYLFGVAEEVIKQLRVAAPDLMTDASVGTASYPWWLWYTASHGSAGDALLPAGSLFQQSLDHTESTARAALSAASGKGFSSAGGSGGGFSFGGGGGFSSGGGAR